MALLRGQLVSYTEPNTVGSPDDVVDPNDPPLYLDVQYMPDGMIVGRYSLVPGGVINKCQWSVGPSLSESSSLVEVTTRKGPFDWTTERYQQQLEYTLGYELLTDLPVEHGWLSRSVDESAGRMFSEATAQFEANDGDKVRVTAWVAGDSVDSERIDAAAILMLRSALTGLARYM